jgi:hypothetical protein
MTKKTRIYSIRLPEQPEAKFAFMKQKLDAYAKRLLKQIYK